MKNLKDLNQKNIHLTHLGVIGRLDHTIPIDVQAHASLDADKPNLEMENSHMKYFNQKNVTKILSLIAIVMLPALAFASVESSLSAVQEKLVGTILPLGAMCGLVIAGLSFVAGHANAKAHLMYAIMGAIVGFGAESIVSLIRSLVH